jgi:hypothetical protein
MAPVTNPIDISTIANVKAWTGVISSNEDQTIQDALTAFSSHILHLTGRGPADGSIPAASPFTSVVSYDEFYDGNGNDRLPLRNWPIQSVTLVSDAGRSIASAVGFSGPGYVVDQSKKFIVLRGMVSPGYAVFRSPRFGHFGFTLGTQNIEVQYTAGFSAVPFDLEMLARKVVALNYKSRQWIGQKSQAMAAGAGTVSYDWKLDPIDLATIEFYKRRMA